MNKKIIALLVLLLAGALIWRVAGDFMSRGGDGFHGGGSGGGLPVETQSLTAQPLERAIEATGSLISNESVVLSPEIAGRVAAILFIEGQDVKKGTPLIQLDDSVYKAELDDAEASLNLAKSNYERAKQLLAKQSGTERARDEAMAALESAQARANLARARIEKTTLAAPFDGIIGLRKISVGDYITPGQNLVNLESLDPLKVDFRIPEIYLNAVAPQQRIQLRVDAFPGHLFEGTVYAIDPRIDESGRSIVLRALLPNDDGKLRPGLFARVNLIIERKDKALSIPEQAIVPSADAPFVYKVIDGKAVMAPVITGLRQNGQVEITAGLKAGDIIITAGQMKIGPGMPVTALPAGAPEKPAQEK